MLFPIKSESEILQEMMSEVVTNTGITNLTPGSIARSLLEIFNSKLAECYRYLDIYTSMSFLSTAEGMYLDMIGEMLGCSRIAMETDSNYRYRISKQSLTAAAANRTSIRLKCFAIPEVKDIIMTPYSRGNGSFTIHVITDEIDTPSDILAQVDSIVQETKAEGIQAIIAKPTVVPIDLKFNVIPKTKTSTSEITLSSQIRESLNTYINTIPMGGVVSIQEMLRIAQVHPSVSQAYVNSLSIDGKAAIIDSVYQLNWDERAYISSAIVII